jgi:hypothetical protein
MIQALGTVPMRPAPRIMFLKAHVKGYTRHDGVYVKPHEDRRVAADEAPTSVQQTPEEIYQQRRIEYIAATKAADAAYTAWFAAKFDKAGKSDEEKSRLKAVYEAADSARTTTRKAMEAASLERSQIDLFNPDEVTRVKTKRIKAVCANMAKHFDFPIEKVGYSDEPYIFELNGVKLTASGTANLLTGEIITIYPKDVDEAHVDQIMAHEVGHHRFEAVTNARTQETKGFDAEPRKAYRHTDAAGNVRMLDFMRPDGTLREGYAEKYPIYAMTEQFNANGMADKLAKEDGVTKYSRDWWTAYQAGTASRHQAMHETFAEISSLEYQASQTGDGKASLTKLGIGPTWRKLYRAYQKAYKGIVKAQKATKQ